MHLLLKGCGESIKGGNGSSVGSSGFISLALGSSNVAFLNFSEESSSLLLLLSGFGKSSHSSTSFIHVTGELILYVEPLLLLDVAWDFGETILGLGKDGLLTGKILSAFGLVKRFVTELSVYRVGRIKLLRLVNTVGSSLRVSRSISDKSENRETRGLSNGSVSGNRKEGSSGSGDLSENLTTLRVDGGGNAGVIGL